MHPSDDAFGLHTFGASCAISDIGDTTQMANSANIHKSMRCNDFMVLQENGDTKHYNITQMNSIVSSSKKIF